MGNGVKIGIIYNGNDNWTGGKNYIINLINGISRSNYQHKIYLFVLNHKDYKEIRDQTICDSLVEIIYPYPTNIIVRVTNRLSNFLFRRNLLQEGWKVRLDVLFPATNHSFFNNINSKLFWIPDIQEKIFPEFFTQDELILRNHNHQELISKGAKFVFSSNSARMDFAHYYPCINEKFVLQFAVTIGDFRIIDKHELLSRFDLPQEYFYVPNQFWQHKNHKLLVQAVDYLRDTHKMQVTIAFSGNENDYRNPDFINYLKSLVKEKNLEGQIKFLGFIERIELLNLIYYAKAIIQPSLFEGWSTVVEESKMMNKRIFLSDIPVHREQITVNATFFDPYDHIELANLLMKPIEETMDFYNEDTSVKAFGNRFMEIVKKLNEHSN